MHAAVIAPEMLVDSQTSRSPGGALSPKRTTVSRVVGLLLLVTGTVALAVRYLPIPNHLVLYLVLLSPVLAIAAPLAALVLLWGRRWRLALLAGILTAALIVVQVPWYVGETAPAALPVRVMTINMRLGEADAGALVREATQSADVVMVEELTPALAKRLRTAGVDQTFPDQAVEPRPYAGGTGIYSRYQMTDHHFVGGFNDALVTATLEVDGAAAPVRVVALHADAPWPQPVDGWRDDFEALDTLFSSLATTAGQAPVIVGGDFNATVDMSPFRNLLTNGYRDAAHQAGSGRQLTYPADERFPPLIGIDHVLTRNAVAVSVRTVEVPGSDHRGLLATVMVPKVS